MRQRHPCPALGIQRKTAAPRPGSPAAASASGSRVYLFQPRRSSRLAAVLSSQLHHPHTISLYSQELTLTLTHHRAQTTPRAKQGKAGHGDAGGRREGRGGEEGARQGAVAAVPAARGGAGVGAMDHPRLLRRQHHRLRHHHVRQQLPQAHGGARRQVHRPLPRPLRLPAAATEPAPRPFLRHAHQDGGPCLGEGGAPPPGLAPPLQHVAPRRRHPPGRQHALPPLRRHAPRTAVRIREDRRDLHPLRPRRRRAVIALHPEPHLRGRIRRALRPAGRHALRAPHQLDYLHQQGVGRGHAPVRRRRQPGARHPAPRQQFRPHRRLRRRVPPRLRRPHAPPLRVDGALQHARRRAMHRQEVPRLPMDPPRRRPAPPPHRIRGGHGDGVPGLQRQRKLPLVSLPQLRAKLQMELHQLMIHDQQQQHELPPPFFFFLPSLSMHTHTQHRCIPFGRGTVTVDSFFDGVVNCRAVLRSYLLFI